MSDSPDVWSAVVIADSGPDFEKVGNVTAAALYRAYQQDPARVRAWKHETYPRIRADAAEAGVTIFFADEAGVRTDHHAGTTEAPWGARPWSRLPGNASP